MRVHHLDCGTMCPLAVPQLVCHCLLVEAGERLILIESGYGLDDVHHTRRRMGRLLPLLVQPVLDESQCAVNQVRALGLSPDDVTDIVLTHMDADHVGGISDFPRARVHVMADELRGALEQPTRFERARFKHLGWARSARFCTYAPAGEPWYGFQCVRQLDGLPPEVLLVPLPGHTRGHAGVALQTPAGWLLHCGDAYYHHGDLADPPRVPAALRLFARSCFDDRARRHNLERLRALAAQRGDEVQLFCAHDARELERQRHVSTSHA